MARIIGAVAASHTPTIGFAYDRDSRDDPAWAPIFENFAPLARWLQAPSCTCSAHQESCTATTHCLNRLSPAQVWSEAKSLLQAAHDAKTKPLVN